jgi:hypothetical protein
MLGIKNSGSAGIIEITISTARYSKTFNGQRIVPFNWCFLIKQNKC